MANTLSRSSQKPLTLSTGQSVTLSAANTVVQGDGVANETVVVQNNAWNDTISGVDTINLPGKVTDYLVGQLGNKDVISSVSHRVSLTDTPDQGSGTKVHFEDGSQVSFLPDGTVHYDNVVLPARTPFVVPNSSITIQSGGKDNIIMQPNQHDVTIKGLDSNSTLDLRGALVENVTFTFSGPTVSIKQGTTTLATIDDSALAQASIPLYFKNGSGTLSISASGDQFQLKNLQMPSNETYTLPNSGVTVIGNASDTVVLSSVDTNEKIIGAGKVVLPGAATDYRFEKSFESVIVQDASGNTVATLSGIRQETLSFADGSSHTLTFSGGKYLIDGNVIPSGSFVPLGTTGTSAGSTAPGTSSASTATSGGTGTFHFTIATDNSLGSYTQAVETDLTKALNDIGKYLNAQGSLDLFLTGKPLNGTVLAQAQGVTVSTPSSLLAAEHNATQSTIFQIESQTGSDPNGASPDATVTINTSLLSRMNLDPTKAPAANQYDLTTVLEHELLHAMGFAGYLGTSSSATLATAFDEQVQFINGAPYFVGKNAEAVYGGPVPLAPASAGPGSAYYHVNVPNDLMDTSLAPGLVRTISTLDVAMLKDLGIPEVTTVGVPGTALHAEAALA